MHLRDIRSEQCLDAIEMVFNDDLIVRKPIQHISVLNHNILKFVICLLKLIDSLIKGHDMIEEGGRKSGLRRGEVWFDMLTIFFGYTYKFFVDHILDKFSDTSGNFEELNVLRGGWSNYWHRFGLFEFMI